LFACLFVWLIGFKIAQAASGAGAPGMQELLDETKKYVNTGEMPTNKVIFDQVDKILSNICVSGSIT
jgi:aspartate-semialdehyde dehydrogenase